MKCIDGCYFLNGYYCDLYEKELHKISNNVMRCKECENGETLYYTRIKDAKKRMDSTKKTKRRR